MSKQSSKTTYLVSFELTPEELTMLERFTASCPIKASRRAMCEYLMMSALAVELKNLDEKELLKKQ